MLVGAHALADLALQLSPRETVTLCREIAELCACPRGAALCMVLSPPSALVTEPSTLNPPAFHGVHTFRLKSSQITHCSAQEHFARTCDQQTKSSLSREIFKFLKPKAEKEGAPPLGLLPCPKWGEWCCTTPPALQAALATCQAGEGKWKLHR